MIIINNKIGIEKTLSRKKSKSLIKYKKVTRNQLNKNIKYIKLHLEVFK